MNTEIFLKEFEQTLQNMLDTAKKKNADYAWQGNPFKNFMWCENLSITTAEKWILIRITDKLSRVINLLDKENQVKDEAIEDSCIDAANYFVILSLLIKSKKLCLK